MSEEEVRRIAKDEIRGCINLTLAALGAIGFLTAVIMHFVKS